MASYDCGEWDEAVIDTVNRLKAINHLVEHLMVRYLNHAR